MSFTIEDGTGKGYQVGVDDENRLKVSSISETREHVLNHEFGRAYSYGVNNTPAGAGNCFFFTLKILMKRI